MKILPTIYGEIINLANECLHSLEEAEHYNMAYEDKNIVIERQSKPLLTREGVIRNMGGWKEAIPISSLTELDNLLYGSVGLRELMYHLENKMRNIEIHRFML